MIKEEHKIKILHLTIGLPNNTSGGLPKYAFDLAQMQSMKGHNVSFIFPGRHKTFNRKSKIYQRRFLNFEVFEILNPLFIPIPYGLSNPNLILNSKSNNIFVDFFTKNKFDVIHVHTIMGIHEDFFLEAKKFKNKIYFTSHDYYPLCLKTNLFDNNGSACSGPSELKCLKCNSEINNSIFISKFIRGNFFKTIKTFKLIILVKKTFQNFIIGKKISIKKPIIQNKNNLLLIFYKFIQYNKRILSTFDFVFYNSKLTQSVYIQNNISIPNKVIPINLKHITDNRSILKKSIPIDCIKFGYVGPKTEAKGFYNLLEVFKGLNNLNNVKLFLWGDNFEDIQRKFNFTVSKGYFSTDKIKDVFSSFDVLIVPSLWKETFGFTVLEALSYGIPVIVSNNVGANDLINSTLPELIYSSKSELSEIINRILLNKNILSSFWGKINTIDKSIFNFDNHVDKITSLYNL